jgi:hypothetical protein
MGLFDFMNPAALNPAANPTPQEIPTPAAPLQNQWESYLQNPTVLASMMSAGLNMMRPSWGGTGQQVVSGLGAGAETWAARDEAERQIAGQERDRAEKGSDRAERRQDKDLDRAQALEIAKMNVDSRKELFNMKGAQPGKNNVTQYFKELVDLNTDVMGGLKEGVSLEELHAQAQEMAAADRGQSASVASPNAVTGRTPASGGGNAPPAEGAGPNSQTSGALQVLPADPVAAAAAYAALPSGAIYRTPDGQTKRKK